MENIVCNDNDNSQMTVTNMCHMNMTGCSCLTICSNYQQH